MNTTTYPDPSLTCATPRSPATQPGVGWLVRVAGWAGAALRRKWQDHRTRVALEEMEDHVLEDIGLKRTSAGHVVRL